MPTCHFIYVAVPMPVKINFNVNEQNKVYLIWIPIFKKAQILIGDSSFRDVLVEKLPRFSGSSVCLQTLIPNSGFWCFSEITDPLAHSAFVSRLCPSLKMVRRGWVEERHSLTTTQTANTVYKPCEIQAFSCLICEGDCRYQPITPSTDPSAFEEVSMSRL